MCICACVYIYKCEYVHICASDFEIHIRVDMNLPIKYPNADEFQNHLRYQVKGSLVRKPVHIQSSEYYWMVCDCIVRQH